MKTINRVDNVLVSKLFKYSVMANSSLTVETKLLKIKTKKEKPIFSKQDEFYSQICNVTLAMTSANLFLLIGRVRFINIQAWLGGFMVKFHGSVLFSLCHKSQGIFLSKTMFKFNHKAMCDYCPLFHKLL